MWISLLAVPTLMTFTLDNEGHITYLNVIGLVYSTYGNKNKFQSEGNEVCTPVIESYGKELEILYAQGMGTLQAG